MGAEDAQPWQAHIHLPLEMSSLDCMGKREKEGRTAPQVLSGNEGRVIFRPWILSKHMDSTSESDLS
jgi:hypothetical protein